MIFYFCMGLWTYVVACCCRSDSFKGERDGAWWFGTAVGFVFGILLWPIAPLFCLRHDLGKLA